MNKELKYDLIRTVLLTLYMEDKISFLQWQSIMSRVYEKYRDIPSNSLAIVKNEL